MDIAGPVPGIPGAIIRQVENVPEDLSDSVSAGLYTQALPGRLLITVPGVGRFLVRDGLTIDVAVEPGADPGMVALLLHGSARGALIHQRGELPLHAATLIPPGGNAALAICGASGAGKSTMALELSRRGWTLVADDTTRVTGADVPWAWPSRDSIKLWRDACETRDIDVSGLDRVAASFEKYYLRVGATEVPVKLAVVVELAPGETPAGRPIGERTAGEKMALLTRHTFRPHFICPLGRTADYARLVAQVANACRMKQFHDTRARPIAALADAIADLMP